MNDGKRSISDMICYGWEVKFNLKVLLELKSFVHMNLALFEHVK